MREDIQGLRAIAVFFVLAFHLWDEEVAGGYFGVDV
jgi:peptidoglycan/LPS O-acetylase OafA/YrhL